MEFELPIGKLTKTEFFDRIELMLAVHGFERKRHRFVRMPKGYVRAQVIDFVSCGGRAGQFILAPYLFHQINTGRGTLKLSLETPVGDLVATYGMLANIERANFVGFYDNWFSDPDWFELFERVLGKVLEGLDPIMKDQELLEAYLKTAFGSSRLVNVSATQNKTS